MAIRMSARIAGLVVLVAEATAVAPHVDDTGAGLWFWTVLLVLQLAAMLWATDRRSSAALRTAVPAPLTAVAVGAGWTALALAVPVIATGNTVALVAILVVGPAIAVASRRTAGQRRLPLALIASAGTALLIFLAISCVLPMVPGFVGTSHPPTFTDVTRLVDPVGELGIFVLLAAALGVDLLRTRIRTRRAASRAQGQGYGAGPNEMIIERTG
ncbi:hypothetical protein [Actinoplanes lobatus]|nr:hypothetical protein [Actinoplanes lobatus]MBB4751969.1 hypothetical protein [Actinoplanes lobatus]